MTLLRRALMDPERGLGDRHLQAIRRGALEQIAVYAGRRRTGGLQHPGVGGARRRGWTRSPQKCCEDVLQRKTLLYDKSGEEHYNLISALHKSVRSSDVEAALYWLARMLEAGEDRMYLARRLMRMAIEDIGMADPRALEQAVAVQQCVHFLGIPEGDQALAQIAIYLSLAPKSDAAYSALNAARCGSAARHSTPCADADTQCPHQVYEGMGVRFGVSARAQFCGRSNSDGMFTRAAEGHRIL